MSHYSNVKTAITDQACLLKALADLGFGPDKVEVHEQSQPLVGYHGDQRSQKAHVIIRRKHIGHASNDIGFVRGKDGSFEAIISDFDRTSMGYNQGWLDRLAQRYSYQQVLTQVELQGFTLVEETSERGEIHMTLSKAMVAGNNMGGF